MLILRSSLAFRGSHISPRVIINNTERLCSSGPYHSSSFTSKLEKFHCVTAEDLEETGARIAKKLPWTGVLLLRGTLGSGKTTLTRGIIREIYNDPVMHVVSPSYLLCNTYSNHSGRTVNHIDLYRLPTGSDLKIINIPHIYETSLCIIEWPQRMATVNVPEQYLMVNIEVDAQDKSRTVEISRVTKQVPPH